MFSDPSKRISLHVARRGCAGLTTFPCDLLKFKNTSVLHVLSNVQIYNNKCNIINFDFMTKILKSNNRKQLALIALQARQCRDSPGIASTPSEVPVRTLNLPSSRGVKASEVAVRKVWGSLGGGCEVCPGLSGRRSRGERKAIPCIRVV